MMEQQRVYRIKSLDSLLGFLREDLCWDLPEASIDDVSFEWTGLDLNLSEDVNKKLKDGLIRQLQSFATHQPWGIFVVEFVTCEVSIITLRQILRCFVAKRRGARPDLPAWQCENLLFICLYGENGFTFAHFKGDNPYSSKLTTFSWHPGEPIRTVCEFNLPALGYNYTWTPETWVEEWQKAFDVERVNKDFYKQIARFYYRLIGKEGQKRELVLPYVGDDSGSISIYEEFAVRLIGRSIFCWFLKHKESKNDVPLIPPEALSLAAAQKTEDFYHSMLEPLFFEVMNKRLKDRNPLAIPRSEIIPFLNGGLFEPHPNDFYPGVPNYGLKIPDTWFTDFFSLLERYNFTITENSSIDVDVAVDPEMLGRIFENLLAEVVPETGETARKATGSYYTPRAIVDYMVEQSLKQYLLTKTELGEEKVNRLVDYGEGIEDFSLEEKLAVITALREIRVIDPACGSGAFPMGILHRMLAVLEKADPKLELWRAQYLKALDGIVRQTVEKNISRENWRYIRKLMIIRDSVYGVDIQPIAVEIAKLRCFLSLVVDEIVLDNEENRGIEPLPNLEFKFVAANTLIGLPEAARQGAFGVTEKIEKLRELRENYLRSFGADRTQIENEFRATQRKLFEENVRWAVADTLVKQLTEWDPFSYESCGWFDPAWMFGIEDGFDIVIANPPYISMKKFPKDASSRKYKDYLLENYCTFASKSDLYCCFFEKSLGSNCVKSILRNEGILTFICSSTFFCEPSFQKLRELMLNNRILLLSVPRGDVFESSLVNTAVVSIKKNPIHRPGSIELYEIDKGGRVLKTGLIEQQALKKLGLFLKSNSELAINVLDKFGLLGPEHRFVNLKNVLTINNGIATADNDLWLYEKNNYSSEELWLSNKVFKNKNNVKDFYRGENVRRWFISKPNSRINYLPDLMKKHRSTARPKAPDFFETRKLVSQLVGEELRVAYDDVGRYFDINVNLIYPKTDSYDLKFILAFLNSKLLNFVLDNLRSNISLTLTLLYKIPVRRLSSHEQEPFMGLVDQILAITKNGDYLSNPAKQVRVKELECQIDQMVYELYGLTPEEIALVEESQ